MSNLYKPPFNGLGDYPLSLPGYPNYIQGPAGAVVPQVSLISAINSDTYYYYADFIGTYPNYKTLPPFDITYTPTTNGTFVINSSALISLDESTNSIWRLKGVINDTTCGVCNVYGLSGGNTPNPGMAFVGSYVATAGQEYNITLQASQENASGDEALQNVAWSVAFYPF